VRSSWAQIPADPHNLLLWVAVSAGVVGLILFLWFAFEVARNWVLQLRSGDDQAVLPFVLSTGSYALVVLTAPAPLQTALLAALVLGASLRPERRASVPALAGGAVKVAGALAALVVIFMMAFALTRVSIAQTGVAMDPTRTQGLADVWRVDPYLYYRAAYDWVVAKRTDPMVGQAMPDLAAVRRASELAPYDPVYATEYARILGSYRRPRSEVEPAFARAIRLFPSSPDAHSAYAEYLLGLGDTQGAARELRAAQRVGVSAEIARVWSLYFAQTGDQEQAAQWLQRAEQLRAAASGVRR